MADHLMAQLNWLTQSRIGDQGYTDYKPQLERYLEADEFSITVQLQYWLLSKLIYLATKLRKQHCDIQA